MATIDRLLQPRLLSRLVSRKMSSEKWILNFMGFGSSNAIGGDQVFTANSRNEVNLGHGRKGNFDVFNNTRSVGETRAPGAPAANVRRQKVGNVPFDYPRMYEQVSLLSEELHNLRAIGEDGARDVAGARMIELQTRFLAQRSANFRAALTLGMLRDELYVHKSGDHSYLDFSSSGAQYQINFQMPDGTGTDGLSNRGQLDMVTDGTNIIDVSWDNPSANIPKHLADIDAAFQELYGGRLENCICGSAIWQYVLENDHVGSQAGIANTPFQMFERQAGVREDGSPMNLQVARLSCRPFLDWYVTDEGLEMGAPGTDSSDTSVNFRPFVGANEVIFMGSPDAGNFFMQIGSEPVVEYDGGPETVRFGQYLWSNKTYNSPRTNIFSLDNALAVNDIPNSVAYGTVVF